MNKKLFKNSFVFTLGEFLNKSIPFILLPILTRYLTPSDYGIIAIFNVIVVIFSVFIGLSVHGAININFFKMKKTELQQFIGNCMLILVISTLVISLLTFILSPYILEKILIQKFWLFTAILLAVAQFLTTINLLLWTVEERPKPYTIYQVLQTLTITAVSLVLIIGFKLNWEGRLIGIVTGTLLFSVISMGFIIKRGYLVLKIRKDHLKDALFFGVPLIPHQLSNWIKTSLDRVIILSTLGASIVGIYAVGYQIALVMDVLVFSFNKGWSPYMNKTLSNNPTAQDKKNIVKFTYLYFISVLIICVVFIYFIKLVLPYFVGEKFNSSFQYIPYFSISFAFKGMYYMIANYIFFTKKTYLLSIITFTSSMIHIGLLYVLTKSNGSIGAAQATLISTFITFLISWFLASKIYEMPWKIWKNV